MRPKKWRILPKFYHPYMRHGLAPLSKRNMLQWRFVEQTFETVPEA